MKTGSLAITEATRARLDDLFTRYRYKRDALLTALYLVQDECGCLSEEVLTELAAVMEMPKSVIYEVVTFYSLYSTKPRGANIVMACQNLCCYLRSSDELVRAICDHLQIEPGGTTEDGRFTLHLVECLAACERAPAMMVNEQTFGPVTPAEVVGILERFRGDG